MSETKGKNSDWGWVGKRVVVMGLGRFGGGIAVSRWLVEQGADVTVTDLASADKLVASVEQLKDLPVTFRLDGHDEKDLDQCDLLVVSPAVPKERSAFVQQAEARGIPLSSEMNLFIEHCPARRIVGVTGSAGKSTTTAMLGSILQAAAGVGRIPQGWMGGNIGRSLLDQLPRMSPDDVVVLELSSFQLEDLARLQWSPPYAVLTNIRPNHLDRHGTLENYAQAKLNIVRFQKEGDVVFIPFEDEDLAEYVGGISQASTVHLFDFDPVFEEAMQVPGGHNRDNAAAAIAGAGALGIHDEIIQKGLASFKGLPHRLEFVAEKKGVRFYNDSKSTTPESSLIALHAFTEPVVMLVGGGDKGMSFDLLAEGLAEKAKAVVCYGQTGPVIYDLMRKHIHDHNPVRLISADTFSQAVKKSTELADVGDVVVLSPACTSYDMFTNYEQRGDAFRRLIETLET